MDKLTFKEWSILSDLQTIAPLGEDFEFSMARGELKTAKSAISRLMKHLNGEGDLEAWVQSKITKAAEYLDTVADHMDGGEDDTKRFSKKEVKEGFKGHKSVEEISKKHKVSPSLIQKQLEMGMKVEHEHTTDNDEAMDIALQHLDEIPNYYSKLKKMEKVKEDWSEKYKKSIDCDNPKGFSQRAHCQGRKKRMKESVEILDADGNLFATIIDIIKGSDYKFKSFTQPVSEKCWDGYKQVGMKKKGEKVVPNCVKEDSIDENKSGDSSLHDWFTKSRSSDGTPGWVQLGGKHAGEPCAKQPGQTTKPKCGSSKMKADLSDKEEESAFRRKNQEDPNPDRKGKAKMVATEENTPIFPIKEPGVKRSSESHPRHNIGFPHGTAIKYATLLRKRKEKPAKEYEKKGEKKKKVDAAQKHLDRIYKVFEEKKSDSKDACYSKVKSRYKVWPSAYASGALVKCRKVGAKNWGTKSENMSYSDTDDLDNKDRIAVRDTHLHSHKDSIRYCPMCQRNEKAAECKYGEKYWKMFSTLTQFHPKEFSIAKVHPANEDVSFEIGAGHRQAQRQAKIRNLATGTTNKGEKDAAMRKLSGPSLPLADSVINPGQITNEDYQRIQSTGNVYTILFSWRGRPMMNLQLFFPNMKRPSKDEVKTEIEKFYPGAVIMQWYPSPTDPSKPIVVIQGK
jgi:hypothetical protein